jgi:hypothetical protein
MTTNSVSYRTTALALVAGMLMGIAGGVGYERRGELMRSWQPAVFGQQAPTTEAPATIAGPDEAAIQQLIQHANDEQVQAIASKDPSGMADTATGDHYQQMQQINQDLLDHGVSQIQLTRLEWGPVAVNGDSASATTFETWTTTYSDGTSDTSRDTNQYSLVQDNGSWKISADVHPDDAAAGDPTSPFVIIPGEPGQPAPAPFVTPPDTGTSHNWSGYNATGGTFTSVTGTWTVPQVSTSSAQGASATWVGIGGVSSRDLIQAGTEDTASGTGRTRYEAWVETLPQPSHPIKLAVSPGDSVTVSLTEQSTGTWALDFKNNTSGQEYKNNIQYDSSESSAEWVEEAPSGGRNLLPLDAFGTVTFSSASATKNGQTLNVQQLGATSITMKGAGNATLATPSPIGADGSSFSITRSSATASPAPSGPRLGRGSRGGYFPVPGVLPGGG